MNKIYLKDLTNEQVRELMERNAELRNEINKAEDRMIKEKVKEQGEFFSGVAVIRGDCSTQLRFDKEEGLDVGEFAEAVELFLNKQGSRFENPKVWNLIDEIMNNKLDDYWNRLEVLGGDEGIRKEIDLENNLQYLKDKQKELVQMEDKLHSKGIEELGINAGEFYFDLIRANDSLSSLIRECKDKEKELEKDVIKLEDIADSISDMEKELGERLIYRMVDYYENLMTDHVEQFRHFTRNVADKLHIDDDYLSSKYRTYCPIYEDVIKSNQLY